jgi:hypothetical protein
MTISKIILKIKHILTNFLSYYTLTMCSFVAEYTRLDIQRRCTMSHYGHRDKVMSRTGVTKVKSVYDDSVSWPRHGYYVYSTSLLIGDKERQRLWKILSESARKISLAELPIWRRVLRSNNCSYDACRVAFFRIKTLCVDLNIDYSGDKAIHYRKHMRHKAHEQLERARQGVSYAAWASEVERLLRKHKIRPQEIGSSWKEIREIRAAYTTRYGK